MIRMMTVVIAAAMYACCPTALAQDEGSEPPATAHESPFAVDLHNLLEKVSESSGKEFLVEARVPPRIYVRGTDLDDPTYPVLLSILRNNGLAAAEIEGYVNILPDAAIRQLPLRLVQRDDADIPDDEWVARVIAVGKGNAAQFVPILRPLIPQAGHLSASHQGSNKLIVVASYAKVRHITDIVDLLTE